MAITRTEIAKQLLAYGGRIGLKKGDMPDRQQYSATQTQTGVVKGGGKSLGGGKFEDAVVTGDDLRTARREFERDVGESQLDNLKIKDRNLPGLLNMGLNLLNKPRQFMLDKNVNYFKSLSGIENKGYPKTAEGYRQYMQDRLAGKIDAAGNLIMGGDDDNNNFIPVDTTFNMDQETEKEEDEGLRLAFRADGGRIGLQEGGGIEQRLEQLGGDVTSAEQMLQGINQRLKTAESSLGSGGSIGGLASSVQTPDPFFGKKPLGGIITLDGKFLPGNIDNQGMSAEMIAEAKTEQLGRLPAIAFQNPEGNLELRQPNVMQLGMDKQVKFDKDPYARTLLSGLSQDGQRFDSAQSAFDALAEYTRKAREFNPGTRDMIGTELFQGAEGFKNFTNLFNQINDPNYVAPSLQLASAGPFQAQGVSGGSLGVPALGFAEGGPVGGIMDLETGRQMYFLGKLVKKATRAVKKIVKSPIGKAALFATPFLMNPAVRTGIGSFLRDKVAPFLFKDTSGSFMDMLSGGLTGKGKLALGGALTLAPLLFQEDDQKDEYQKFLAQRSVGGQLPASIPDIRNNYRDYMATAFLADGGRPEPVAKKTMPLLDMDGKEKDYRETGGFVDMGRMERADDVPARLSKNELVFTADAVRNAGEGDIDKGAEVMYNMMKNLEAGGEVSEESQGLDGARKMFQTSQRLEEVL